ncbi:MAG: tyrosine-type recombinase/integrase [Phycisphaerales bacterium]
MERHDLLGGRIYVFKRPRSRFWQCGTFLENKKQRESTKQESLTHAMAFAEKWYFDLIAAPSEKPKQGKSFREAADQFRREYQAITLGQRNPDHVESHWRRLELHLIPFFDGRVLSEITPGLVQEYRVKRAEPSVKAGKLPDWKEPRVPSRSTMHKEIVTLRQVLKTAHRHGWLQHMPDLTPPYKTSGKITHRAWFSPKEYEQLYKATRKRAQQPLRKHWKSGCEDLHDFVLFMANTGLRPDEAWSLQNRDATIVDDEATGERIVEIEVRGKRGLGFCKSMAGAVRPLERIRTRNKLQPTDLIFPNRHRELFNAILEEQGLKFDRDGNRRTAYSLRHTYICLRLMEGADIYQIAKNCRTSVEMIETYYAAHIKTTLDAAAINVRRPKPTKNGETKRP